MRAAWWWIDRWRQSRAYTDMTAEEQGLYRNLCDEVWLREDHVIPDDPRILARVSGDPEAWARCRTKVLGWMKRVKGGWTNETALEVIEQSTRRAETQRRYRERLSSKDHNARHNASDNKVDNTGDSPSPSPSQDKTQSPDQRKRLAPATAVAVASPSWSREACDDWIERFHGTAPGGPIGKALKPLVDREGWPAVRVAWRSYLEQTEAPYASPSRFASTFGQWNGTAPAPRAVNPKAEQRAEGLRAFMQGSLTPEELEEEREARSLEERARRPTARLSGPRSDP